MKKLLSRNFVLLWQGQFVSRIGTFLFDIALILWIKEYSDNAALISLILIASNVPEILLAPIGGTIADMFSRKKIIVFTDFISGLLIVGVSGALAFDLFSDSTNLLLLFLLSLSLGVCNACFSPAVSALIPQLVDKKNLHSANSLFQATRQLAMVIGQGIGGILFMKLGAALLFFLNGISYVFSGFSEMLIKENGPRKDPNQNWKETYKKFLVDFYEGFHYCWSNQQLRYLLLIIGIYHFFVAPLPILLPFWVSDTLGLSEQWLGYLFANFALGILAGFTVAGIVDLSKKNISRFVTALFLTSSILFVVFGLFNSVYVSMACLFLLGSIIGVVIVIHITLLQRITPQSFHGRVFGFINTITNASVPIGLGIYGLLLDILNKTISHSVSPTKIIFIFNGILVGIIMLKIITKVRLSKIFNTNEIT